MRKTFCDHCKKEIKYGYTSFIFNGKCVEVFSTNGISKSSIGELCKKCLFKEIVSIATMDMAKDKIEK